jgi:protein-S-isoprenylcysteine O-methyltransferase Ste14
MEVQNLMEVPLPPRAPTPFRASLKGFLRDAAIAVVIVLIVLLLVFVARAFTGATPFPWSLLAIVTIVVTIALLLAILKASKQSMPSHLHAVHVIYSI